MFLMFDRFVYVVNCCENFRWFVGDLVEGVGMCMSWVVVGWVVVVMWLGF